MLSYDEAVARVTAPGQIFELAQREIGGVQHHVFAHAPPTLRQVFAMMQARSDETFLVYEDERWTFGDVTAAIDALAATLVQTYGISPGDRVGIAMRNYPEWVIAFGAITSIGAISVSFNAWWVAEEMAFAIDDAGLSVLIADGERVERSAEACVERGVRVISVRTQEEVAGVDRWDDVVLSGAPMPEVEVDGEQDATILYTSGTTGRPKGAVSTHRAIIQALMGFACRAAVDKARSKPGQVASADGGGAVAADVVSSTSSPPVFILIVPLFHVTGCVPVLLSCVASGIKLVMMYRWDAERALELIERERVTQFVGVPTQSWDLLESPRFDDFDTSSMQKIGGGGAPAPEKLVHRVEDRFTGGGPTIGYGMTETNAYGPQNGGEDYLTHPTSTGRGTPILRIEIRDPDGSVVPVGERGEIWFTGPHLIRGYWNRPDATAETIVDGWLRSGDIGHVDDEGFVYVEDRAKDMVLRGGENVYSAEVESAIYEHPDVYEAAVYGVPHERLGEEVAATVCVREGASLTEDDLAAFLADHLAPFKIPSRWSLVEQPLPRNAAGKMLKTALRDQAAAVD
ncbi:MAG: class I adenylate-forming enzyme family protein [Microthrixaceae bacterium]